MSTQNPTFTGSSHFVRTFWSKYETMRPNLASQCLTNTNINILYSNKILLIHLKPVKRWFILDYLNLKSITDRMLAIIEDRVLLRKLMDIHTRFKEAHEALEVKNKHVELEDKDETAVTSERRAYPLRERKKPAKDLIENITESQDSDSEVEVIEKKKRKKNMPSNPLVVMNNYAFSFIQLKSDRSYPIDELYMVRNDGHFKELGVYSMNGLREYLVIIGFN